ncbi:MAG TPA: sigma-54 dependent transcriptional regulator [Candidatus Polarisedimenticolia bacterium]|nr:sigma-54 dependent transcriptional regulator [Candidatus Polarisedimenticolia bacterium]
MKEKILIIDDDAGVRQVLADSLTAMGYAARGLDTGDRVLATIRESGCDLLVLDMVLPRTDGMEVLQEVHRHHQDLPVIMITGYASVETAIKAMKMGAFDYVVKPFRMEEVELVVAKALERSRLKRENILLRRQIESQFGAGSLAGGSPAMKSVLSVIGQVAATRSTVLITGAVGTGKELVARTLHINSDRKDQTFVSVACGGIPEGLLEDDLFGHVRGAFPDAVSDRQGRIEMASGGTLFLDDVDSLSPSLQAKTLRVLTDREVLPLGAKEAVSVDVRVLAATRQDLKSMVTEGKFREDLYYRLNVIGVHLPELRERGEDLSVLIHHFVHKYSREMGAPAPRLTAEAMRAMGEFPWPGNVRQLENVVERAVALSRGKEEITLEDLPREIQEAVATPMPLVRVGGEGVSLDAIMAEYEEKMLLQALDSAGWVKTRAAELLKIKRTTLIEKMKRLGIPLKKNGAGRGPEDLGAREEASTLRLSDKVRMA